MIAVLLSWSLDRRWGEADDGGCDDDSGGGTTIPLAEVWVVMVLLVLGVDWYKMARMPKMPTL